MISKVPFNPNHSVILWIFAWGFPHNLLLRWDSEKHLYAVCNDCALAVHLTHFRTCNACTFIQIFLEIPCRNTGILLKIAWTPPQYHKNLIQVARYLSQLRSIKVAYISLNGANKHGFKSPWPGMTPASSSTWSRNKLILCWVTFSPWACSCWRKINHLNIYLKFL